MPKTITGLSPKETQRVLYLYRFVEEGTAGVFGHTAELVKEVKRHLSECSECKDLLAQGREKKSQPPDLRPSVLADKAAKEYIELQAIRNMAGEDHPWTIAEAEIEEDKVDMRKLARAQEEAFLKHLKVLSGIG